MRHLRPAIGFTIALAVVGFGVAPLAAEEAKSPVSAGMMLNILSAPSAVGPSTLDYSLREDGPPPRSTAGEVRPDGSVRYGKVTVTVKNPCPPGTAHFEPPPLPGRRARIQ
jgi:hypothetical protein